MDTPNSDHSAVEAVRRGAGSDGGGASQARVPISRRRFLSVGGASCLPVLSSAGALPAGRLAHRAPPAAPLELDGRGGREVELEVARAHVSIGDRSARPILLNGTLPGPILRFREGEEAVVHVHNRLDEATSVHWHGIILPNAMDGVPGVTFDGIPAGESFTYRFPLVQAGTYWYHSHSGFQEQLGHYGALIIDPADVPADPVEREHVILLSDWTFEDPGRILARLRKHPGYYNERRRTLGDFFRDVVSDGFGAAVEDRLMWGDMRMDPTDIADITGTTYHYLVNGRTPSVPWSGEFRPGERVKLRFINGSAATHFDVRIPGLELLVTEVSGQPVEPVPVDEIRIATAETYDVIVRPEREGAFALFAEAMDRSGFALGVLSSDADAQPEVPERRSRPLLAMGDMGMAHGDHAMSDDASGSSIPAGDAHADHAGGVIDHSAHMMDPTAPMAMTGPSGLREPGTPEPETPHAPDGHGPGQAGLPDSTRSRLHEPGVGLGADGRRVLVYSDLRSREPVASLQPPTRELELHLTGNMERFMWSLDGRTMEDSEPIHIGLGERFRLILVNDTMMNHPMHLHGMWMELENGAGTSIPRVHTLNVKPAERVSFLVSADEPGPWAFHCHILYHMAAGMMRIFHVGDAHAHDAHE